MQKEMKLREKEDDKPTFAWTAGDQYGLVCSTRTTYSWKSP